MNEKSLYNLYITENKDIKKNILKEGKDEPVREGLEVYIHYKSKEDNSTKEKYYKFKIGEQKAMQFFEICIKTMKVGEKAEFILNPDYVHNYNKNVYNLIPEEISSTFQIELLNITNNKKKLSDMTYEEKFAIAKKLKEKGVEKYKAGDIPLARDLFKKAIIYLEHNTKQAKDIELYTIIISYLCNCFIKQKEYNNAINFA